MFLYNASTVKVILGVNAFILLCSIFNMDHPIFPRKTAVILGVVRESLRSVGLFSLTVFSLAIYVCLARITPLNPLFRVPGPWWNKLSGIPYMLSAYTMTRHLYVRELHRRYGSIVQIAPNTVSVNTRSAALTIYGSSQCFDKSDAYDLHMKGDGLFFMKERDRHGLRRKVWERAFPSKIPEAYDHIIKNCTQHLVERIQRDSSGPVDFTRCISLWTFDIMASLVYGGSGFESRLLDTDDPLELALECKTAMVAFEFLGHIPWLFHILKHFPSSNFRRFEIFCTERVAERTDVGSVSFQDVFSYWLDPSSVLDKNDLAIETETALIAGSETPASIISLLFFFLLTHSDWHEKLCEELDNTFRTGNANFDFDTLAELPILNAVILEGFRLGAVFSGLPRKTPPDGVFLENHFLPSGTIVSVPIFAYHTDESIFPGPDSFNPARWLDDGQNRFSKNQLLTFGAGPFKCIGVKIAYRLTRLAISRILLDMDLKLPKDFDGDLFWGSVGNLRSTVFKKPLHVQVTSRQL